MRTGNWHTVRKPLKSGGKDGRFHKDLIEKVKPCSHLDKIQLALTSAHTGIASNHHRFYVKKEMVGEVNSSIVLE